MKAQFFIISSVIMIYVIVLTFQYLSGFSDIRLSDIEEHQEFSYISNVKNGFIQTFNTSNISNNGDMNKMVKDIDFTKNFFKQELLKKGVDFDSKFIFFSDNFESNDLSDWTNVSGTPQLVNYTAYDGIGSLYSNSIEYVTENLSGVSEVYARAYVNFNVLPSNPNKYYFMDLYENSNQILGLGLENDNGAYKLIIYSNSFFGGPWASSAISIGNGEWHYFELYWLENGTGSTIEAWYDGQLEIINQTIASGGKGKLINQYNFGGANAVGGTPDFYVDCVAISSDYVGDKCYPDEQNYFDFTLKTYEMSSETEFPYFETIPSIPTVPPAPSTSPQYFQNSTNSTKAGQPTLFSLNWTDDVGLNGYIFRTNNSGTWQNDTWRDFENQSGNAKFIDGFESGDYNSWTGQILHSSGTVAITTSNAYQGANSNNITIPSHASDYGQANEYKTLSTTYSQLFYRFYVKWTSGGPTNAQADGIGLGQLAAGKNLGDAGVIAIVYNNSGSYVWAVRYKNGTSWYTSTSSQPVQQNVWYSVEIKANATGFTLYVNGSPIIDLAGLSITSSYNTVQTGTIYTDAGTWSWTFYTDDVVVSTSYIGPFNSWSNVTKILNTTVGLPIGWCVYANDTSNNWNTTSCSSPFSLITT